MHNTAANNTQMGQIKGKSGRWENIFWKNVEWMLKHIESVLVAQNLTLKEIKILYVGFPIIWHLSVYLKKYYKKLILVSASIHCFFQCRYYKFKQENKASVWTVKFHRPYKKHSCWKYTQLRVTWMFMLVDPREAG